MAREVPAYQKKQAAPPMTQEERETRQSRMRWMFLALIIMFLIAVYLVFELVIANSGTSSTGRNPILSRGSNSGDF